MGPDFIPRHVSNLVLEALSDTPVVVINGARQAGKSTLIESLAKHLDLVTLDNATQRAAAQLDPTRFVERGAGTFAIDEIQRVPELLIAIKESVDRNRTPGRFLLTGSTRLLSTPKLSETLAGRVEIIDLWPLSAAERGGVQTAFIDSLLTGTFADLVPAKLPRTAYLDMIAEGGYPEALQRQGQRRSRWFENYVTTVVERLADDVASIERLHELPRLLELCAARIGNEVNVATLSNDIGIPARTLSTYLAHLQTVFLLQLLPAWSTNLSSKVIRKPKVVLADTGLATHLLGFDRDGLNGFEAPLGQLFENYVAMELIKYLPNSSSAPKLFHFRDRDGVEVDFVLQTRRGAVAGVEVKASNSVSSSDFKGLRYLHAKLGDKFAGGVVLYTGDQVVPFGAKLWAAPMSILWS
jgi:uncharacterized protein